MKAGADDERPERVRMPRSVLWAGAAGLPPMLLILAASPGSGDPAMTIVPLLMIGVFGFLILLYMNWWLDMGPHQLTFRNALGRVRTIRYDDITRAQLIRRGRATHLVVRASDGTRLSLNPATFDLSPLFHALRERGWDLAGRR